MIPTFPHYVERTIDIGAVPQAVFLFFTDSARWASWWGAGSTIDPRVGGQVLIRHPNGIEVLGEVTQIDVPERLSFTYGFASGTPVAPGQSHVTLRLEAVAAGTRLYLRHEFAAPAPAHEHVQGWRFQLSLFSNAVANEVHADAAALADRWFAMWSDPDAAARDRALAALVTETVSMRDRFSLITGHEDLRAHLTAVHRFMPGMTLQRQGDVRHCQGMVLADWIARAPDGQDRATGTNVFTLNAHNRIDSVTGFWRR